MCFSHVSRFTDLTLCRCQYGTVLEPASVSYIHPGISTQIQGFRLLQSFKEPINKCKFKANAYNIENVFWFFFFYPPTIKPKWNKPLKIGKNSVLGVFILVFSTVFSTESLSLYVLSDTLLIELLCCFSSEYLPEQLFFRTCV